MLEDDQRGDASIRGVCWYWIGVGVELEDQSLTRPRAGELVQAGSHRPARAAPVGVAVDHDRDARAPNHTVEVSVRHFDGTVESDGTATGSALGARWKSLEIHPVEHLTEGTGDCDRPPRFRRRTHTSV